MAYTKINWKNVPDVSTPVNADNLNKMDNELYILDEETSGKLHTWTPILGSISNDGSASTQPSATYEYHNGIYKKMGRMMYVAFKIKANITNAGNGYAVVKTLPRAYSTRGSVGFVNVDIGLSVTQCLGAITKSADSSESTNEQTAAAFIILPDNSNIHIQDGSATSQRRWKTGTVWIGASGYYPID